MRQFIAALALLALCGCDRAIFAAADFVAGNAIVEGVNALTGSSEAAAPDGSPLVTTSDVNKVTPTEGYNPLDP